MFIIYIYTGTHDVQNVTADSSNPGQIDIRCSYLNRSIDEGFFTIIVYSSSNLSNITYRVAARNGLEPTTNLSIVNLQHDEYQFVVYDLPSMIPEEKPATEWIQTFVEIAKDSQQNNSGELNCSVLI